MKDNRRQAPRDFSTLFLGGILFGIVMVVFGIMLAFTQARGHAGQSRDTGDRSSRVQRSSGFSINTDKFIFRSMERTRIG